MTMAKPDMKEKLKAGIGSIKSPSIFESTVSVKPKAVEPAQVVPSVAPASEQSFERQTMVITREQYSMLLDFAREVQKNGMKKPERITLNSVVRCLINLLPLFDGDTSKVATEEDLNRLLQEHFKGVSK